MSFDPHKNFAYSTVATAPAPATSGTSLTLQTGDGALFPDPSTDGAFNLTVWPTGVAPLKANAEIVRCTARSGDTLTIARTQEGTSARTIVVGDQIALTITAKLLTDLETNSGDPTVIQVAAPTGVAATDNAVIAAAITACPTGGVVQLQAGTYAIIDSGTTASLALSKKLTLRGRGGATWDWGTLSTPSYGTRLTVDHATAVGISISAHGVHVENLYVQNIHATAPTAGAGIQTVTGGGNGTHYGPDLWVRGFYNNVDHQAGGLWTMDPSFFSLDFVNVGVKIQNVDLVDGGDFVLSGYHYAGPTNNGQYAIQWLSGGGAKVHDVKVNIFGSATLDVGIYVALQDGVVTSDFLLTNSSIENCTWGFLLAHLGPSNTGVFNNVVLHGNQFLTTGTTGATSVVAIAPAATGKVGQVFVGGNVIRGGGASQVGLQFTNVDNATHGPNVFKSNSGFVGTGTNTNIISVGAG